MLPGQLPVVSDNGETHTGVPSKTQGEGGFSTQRAASPGCRTALTPGMWDIQYVHKTQRDPAGLQGLYSEAEKLKTSHQPDVISSIEVMNGITSVALVSRQVSRDQLEEACTHHGRVVDDVPHTFCQLLSSVEWCHQQGIFPGDVTLETLMYDGELKVSRTGVGLTVEFAGYKLHTFRESPGSAAPRAFLRQVEERPPIDVWSLGAVWSSVIRGYEPFEGEVFWHVTRDFEGLAQSLDQGVLVFMSLKEGNIWTSLKITKGHSAWQEKGLSAWLQATTPETMDSETRPWPRSPPPSPQPSPPPSLASGVTSSEDSWTPRPGTSVISSNISPARPPPSLASGVTSSEDSWTPRSAASVISSNISPARHPPSLASGVTSSEDSWTPRPATSVISSNISPARPPPSLASGVTSSEESWTPRPVASVISSNIFPARHPPSLASGVTSSEDSWTPRPAASVISSSISPARPPPSLASGVTISEDSWTPGPDSSVISSNISPATLTPEETNKGEHQSEEERTPVRRSVECRNKFQRFLFNFRKLFKKSKVNPE